MGIPSPTIPSFTDGVVVHQADLNALGSNLTNLYNYNQGGFRTQRDCVIAQQTSGQPISNNTDTLVTFNSTSVNTNNMWVASQATQLTIQTAGIYWIFAQVRWPSFGSPALTIGEAASIFVNGTSIANAVATQTVPAINVGSGTTCQTGLITNLAVGATIYLDVWQNTGSTQTLQINFGGTFLGAVFLTTSS